jgi:hypothetical protein
MRNVQHDDSASIPTSTGTATTTVATTTTTVDQLPDIEMVARPSTVLTPIIVTNPDQESIVKYTFGCIKGRTIDAEITSGGKNPGAHVVVYDSSLSSDGSIEVREFRLTEMPYQAIMENNGQSGTQTVSPRAFDKQFISADQSIVMIFANNVVDIAEYGKVSMYKSCRITSSEIIK